MNERLRIELEGIDDQLSRLPAGSLDDVDLCVRRSIIEQVIREQERVSWWNQFLANPRYIALVVFGAAMLALLLICVGEGR